MKKIYLVLLSACMLFGCAEKKQVVEGTTSTSAFLENGIIKTEVPVRAAGQTDLVGFRTEPMEKVRVAFIGLGMRGPSAVHRFTQIEGVEVTALCDLYPERVTRTQEILTRNNMPKAAEYSGEEGWKELCKRDDVDLVYIVTDWKNHTPMAVYAMNQGKHVAIEVPAAMNLKECWDLVDTAEKTRRHCMMLENCVYDFFELTTLNMAQQGLFGEVLHVEGSYIHNLEQFWSAYQGNWRLDFNQHNRGDVYATHGMGPACQLLDIHRGDKMNYLVAMDTKSVNGPKVVEKVTGEKNPEFKNGDHTLTLIRTQNGKTMHIQHNVLTPRPYSRMYQLTGTDGFANKYPVSGYTLNPENVSSDQVPNHENLDAHSFVSEETKKELMAKYKHPIHVELEEKAKKVGGHGGMDFIMDYRLIYCLRNGLPLDQDVYDAAEWSSMAELTAISMDNNSMPVEVPDFTRGAWNKVKGYRMATVD
ncbi:MAG: Gfo/Idh/MocA family oxidoreductase [Bacteroidales bacterium]